MPLRKDLTRYTPLWAMYFIGMMLVLLATSGPGYYDEFAGRSMDDMVDALAVINIIYAGLCAVTLFGDLFNTKLCYSLHAMPQRRESWLLSHLSAGMLFSLVPNTVAALFLMVQLQDYWFLALYWLLAATLQFLFFFGIGSFSAMLTGSRFAMLTVYVGINLVAMLAYSTVNVLYIPMLTGVVADTSGFSQFSPVVHLMSFVHFRFETGQLAERPYQTYRPYYEYLGLGDGWGYMAILGVVGLVAMAAAWLLYRKRHLEVAGDFVAFPRLKGIACVLITVCVALCFALLGELFGEDGYGVWLAVGLIVGFFGGLMLLERRIKVFRKKTFLGFALMAAVVILSFAAVQFDWFGIESWTPRADRVESVTISNYRKSGYYYDYPGNRISETLTDPEDIEAILTAHQDILDRLDVYSQNTHRVTIEYTLKSGRTVTRVYNAPADGVNYDILYRYFYNEKQLLGYGNQNWEDFVSGIEYIFVDYNEIPDGLHKKLMDALKQDCDTGAISANNSKEYDYVVEYYAYTEDSVQRTLYISAGAENVLALLKTPEFVLGYDDWEEFLDQPWRIVANGSHLATQEEAQGLLTAIAEDVAAGRGISDWKMDEIYLLVTIQAYSNGRTLYLTKEATSTIQWLKNNGYDKIFPAG